MNGRLLLLGALLAAGAGCSRAARPPAAGRDVSAAKRPDRRPVADLDGDGRHDPRAWRRAYDWDGDGEKDEVNDRFSGGGHCCYRVGVLLSSKKTTTWLPFWMDGGYVHPMDLPDIPEQFSIGRTPGGLPEMRMQVATYNGVPASLPQSWRDRYRIRSHFVGVSFPKGNVRVRDLPRATAPR